MNPAMDALARRAHVRALYAAMVERLLADPTNSQVLEELGQLVQAERLVSAELRELVGATL